MEETGHYTKKKERKITPLRQNQKCSNPTLFSTFTFAKTRQNNDRTLLNLTASR